MASHLRAAALRRALEAVGVIATAPPPVPPRQFTDADYYHARMQREAYDRIEQIKRWCVSISPPDHAVRRFYMTGSLESVARRARHIFVDLPCLIAIEPASNPNGGESWDARLNLSPQTERRY